MSTLPRAQQRTNRLPSFFQIARDLYGDAFEARGRNEIGEAMSDWVELTTAEQGFALGHLLYLALRAGAGIHLQLQDIRQLLNRIDESLEAVADDLTPERDEEAGDAPNVPDASLDIPVLPATGTGTGTSAGAESLEPTPALPSEPTLALPLEARPGLSLETTQGVPLETRPGLSLETARGVPLETRPGGFGRGHSEGAVSEPLERGAVSLTLVAAGRGTPDDVHARRESISRREDCETLAHTHPNTAGGGSHHAFRTAEPNGENVADETDERADGRGEQANAGRNQDAGVIPEEEHHGK